MEKKNKTTLLITLGLIACLLLGMLVCYAVFPREKTVLVDKPIYIDKPVVTEKIVYLDKPVEVIKEVPVYIFPEGSGDVSDCVKQHNISACCPIINGERVC